MNEEKWFKNVYLLSLLRLVKPISNKSAFNGRTVGLWEGQMLWLEIDLHV
jgi:hypothetical protein